MYQPVTLAVADGVGHIELNRPEAANTINMPLATALREVAGRVADDDSIDVVLLTGAGGRFCGGGDISSFSEAGDPGRFLTDLATEADAGVQALESLDKPMVAAVHGAVAGAGLGIMLTADVIIAAEGTKFVFAYPSIGLTPDCGASVSLPRSMGLHRALAFALSGRPMSAEQAREQGLITEVASDALARAREVASAWGAGAPGALGATRRLLRLGADGMRAEAGQREATAIGTSVGSTEAQGLITAFLSR
jgi:2-(1,2-epoxy-1,2-dihydrophenyl)acetyl-CoA isomerase